jgi:hypothetical protein
LQSADVGCPEVPIGVDHHRRAAGDGHSADPGDESGRLHKGVANSNGVAFVCDARVTDYDQ